MWIDKLPRVSDNKRFNLLEFGVRSEIWMQTYGSQAERKFPNPARLLGNKGKSVMAVHIIGNCIADHSMYVRQIRTYYAPD